MAVGRQIYTVMLYLFILSVVIMFKAMLETEDKEKSEIFLILKSSQLRMKYLLSSTSFSSSPLNTMDINNRNLDLMLWEYQREKQAGC